MTYDPRYLELSLFHPRIDTATVIAMLELAAEQWGPDLFPNFYYDEDRRGPRQVPITPAHIRTVVEGWNPHHLDELLLFREDQGGETSITVGDLSGNAPCNLVFFDINQELYRDQPHLVESLDELAEALLETAAPLKMHLCTRDDQLSSHVWEGNRLRVRPQRTRLCWRNLWSPLWMSWLGGPDRVASAPWFAIQPLPGGWLRLDTAPSPFEWNHPAHLARRAAIAEHLSLADLEERIDAAIRAHRRQTWPNFVAPARLE
jgi:hypothetical protein